MTMSTSDVPTSGVPTGDVIAHLVAGIVDSPEDVDVRVRSTKRGELFEVRVSPNDLGKVIGRRGRTATAIRTVAGALAGDHTRIDFIDVDRRS